MARGDDPFSGAFLPDAGDGQVQSEQLCSLLLQVTDRNEHRRASGSLVTELMAGLEPAATCAPDPAEEKAG